MTEKDKRKWAIKLSVLGDQAVGKTSLIKKYVTGAFEMDYNPTLGVDITLKDLVLEEINSEVRLILWDIAGQNKYELTRKMFFQGCVGALLIYDVTRPSTFKNVTAKWLNDFKQYGRSNAIFILIGNKIDMKDSIKVQSEDGIKLSKELKAIDFIETSAKYGKNVEKAFEKLVMHVLNNLSGKSN